MATEFTWTISDLERDPETGAIHTAHWRVTGVDGEYTGGSYGSANIPPAPEGVPFTPFDDVTEDDVLSWCFASGLDKATVEANLTAQIDEQKSPKAAKGLPW